MSAFPIPTFSQLKSLPDPEVPKRKHRAKRGANPTPARRITESEVVPPGTPGRTPGASNNWKVGEYKPSKQMAYALERARQHQPPLAIMTSDVRGDPRQGT